MFDHIPKDWGPSYSLWYKLLSYFISDRVELYYFNFVNYDTHFHCVFLLLQASGVQRILAFVFAVFFLSSFINMPLWPRVSHYCIIVIITGIIIAKYFQSSVSKLVIYSLALLVCAFARPELFLTFLICWILTYIFFLPK